MWAKEEAVTETVTEQQIVGEEQRMEIEEEDEDDLEVLEILQRQRDIQSDARSTKGMLQACKDMTTDAINRILGKRSSRRSVASSQGGRRTNVAPTAPVQSTSAAHVQSTSGRRATLQAAPQVQPPSYSVLPPPNADGRFNGVPNVSA